MVIANHLAHLFPNNTRFMQSVLKQIILGLESNQLLVKLSDDFGVALALLPNLDGDFYDDAAHFAPPFTLAGT